MKWEPEHVIRLVAAVGAFLMFAIGALMMWQGISAEGAIDIKSSVLSGSIKTGSAGLFIVFLSFVLIAFVLNSLGKPQQQFRQTTPTSTGRMVGKAFFVLLACFVLSGALASLGFGPGFGMLAGGLGFLTLLCGIAALSFLESE